MQAEDHDILVRLEETVGQIHRELITGNGGPSIKQRVASLEESRAGARGWIAGISAAGAGVWGLLEWFFHKH